MAWSFAEAPMGNVALFGELQANEGTLALGFGESLEGARTLARSSLSEGYGLIRQRFIDGWEAWGRKLIIPECPPDIEREAYISSLVLKVHEDQTFPGSIVASLSVPWGQSSDSSGGYHLVWARDCVEAGLALVAVGQVDGCCPISSPPRPMTGGGTRTASRTVVPTGPEFSSTRWDFPSFLPASSWRKMPWRE